MTKQKGICEECKNEYEYDYNPKYPRKYCHECSAKKKASFEGTNGDDAPEVIKIADKPKDNGFNLTIGNIRIGALEAADRNKEGVYVDKENLIKDAKRYEKYIVTGE